VLPAPPYGVLTLLFLCPHSTVDCLSPSSPGAPEAKGYSAPGSFPRAQTVESNGEVSCSVDETNRIRALLGLKVIIALCLKHVVHR
jgi:hypothetical protein